MEYRNALRVESARVEGSREIYYSTESPIPGGHNCMNSVVLSRSPFDFLQNLF